MAESVYLLGIPVESVAVRLVVAALVAVPLSRLLLRTGIRQPRVRVLVALVPSVVLATVLALSWSSPRLPTLGRPGDGIPIPFGNTYVEFAPMTVQLLIAAWAIVAAGRLGWRVVRRRRAHFELEGKTQIGPPTPWRVEQLAERVARRLDITPPPIAIVDDCVGGAFVHGIRHPRLLLDARLVQRLDHRELEAVLAHELAHIRRRDNLTALLVGIVRDVFFFVPGSGWACRRLHAERELAADQVACATTRRPGALASGLLKVLDLQGSRLGAPVAALLPEMPESTLVGRIRLLVHPQEISPVRRRGEAVVIATATVLASIVGLGAPALVHQAGVRDLMFFWTPGGAPATPATALPSSEAMAFDVYRSMPLEASSRPLAEVALIDDDPGQFRIAVRDACRAGYAAICNTNRPTPTLGLRAHTLDRLPEPLIQRWRATPVITTDMFSFYVYRSIVDQRTH